MGASNMQQKDFFFHSPFPKSEIGNVAKSYRRPSVRNAARFLVLFKIEMHQGKRPSNNNYLPTTDFSLTSFVAVEELRLTNSSNNSKKRFKASLSSAE